MIVVKVETSEPELGGKCREGVPIYLHTGGGSLEEIKEIMQVLQDIVW